MIPEQIERVALLGWAVFPQSQYSKAMCFSGAHDHATHDLDVIAAWCREYPGCNWRLAFGLSGLWGLDIDSSETHGADGVANMAAFAARHGGIPHTATTRSGGGGFCVFFTHNGEPVIGESGRPVPGVDPRRGRQSVTIPPSIHVVTKRPYTWVRAPWDVDPVIAPGWISDAVKPRPQPEYKAPARLPEGDNLRNYATAALKDAIAKVATAPAGNANNTLNREAYGMARFVLQGALTAEEVRSCLLAGARARSMPVREAIGTIESALKARATG